MRPFPGAPLQTMRFTKLRLIPLAMLLLSLAGCGTTRSCGGNDEYLTAVDRPSLRVPAELAASERVAPLAIPPVAANPGKLDPAPRCLDEPPGYFKRVATPSGSPEAVVQAWATAWAERKPDAVALLYSRSFEAPGGGGASAFIEDRRQQVASGPAPSARLEDVVVDAVDDDARVVSFVQRFGQEGVQRVLTLAREGQHWRIVAERTVGNP